MVCLDTIINFAVHEVCNEMFEIPLFMLSGVKTSINRCPC